MFSFGAPVALAEAWRPDKAAEPWLGPFGTVVALLAYGGAASLIISDPESHSAGTTQLAVSAVVVAALVIAGIVVARRAGHGTRPETGRRLPIWVTFTAALALAVAAGLAEETWGGLAVGTAAVALTGFAVLRAARLHDWTVHHAAAVALAFLVVRGVLAFTYFPLLGDVAPGPKYLHNAVMLAIVLLAGWAALRPRPT